jgi:hypothetical protein
MKQTINNKVRILNARPDTLDFRDQMYSASLFEVPTTIELGEYQKLGVPILDQGQEGACTGFGLATVANYLLRKRKIVPDNVAVSARMFYEMARRYDEWQGEDYSGSSARGAMKGWYKHGVCANDVWPYEMENPGSLNDARTSNAVKRPLGAYYRVNHKDLIAMHSALAEVGILYATSSVHGGWLDVGSDGIINFQDGTIGGHAFAIVAYDERGFWIQNSWGEDWGFKGFGLINYDDWIVNGTDIWVARLGAPVTLRKTESIAEGQAPSAAQTIAYTFSDLRPHIISIGNNGLLRPGGDYGTSLDNVATIFREDFPRITEKWSKKRLLLYAHGGLVSEKGAVQRLAEYRPALLAAEVYPISFIWKSDAWTTITNILQDALSRNRPEGFLDNTKDFLLDRLDDMLEPLARALSGKVLWSEMKENALLATESENGGARQALKFIAELASTYRDQFELHLVGHSAGSILHAPLIRLLTSDGQINDGPLKGTEGLGLKISTCTMWAPACTIKLFKENYLPSILNKSIGRFALFTLTDKAEQDDNCAKIYNKSLLYLVSDAFEEKERIPLIRDGEPILGMEKFVLKDDELSALFRDDSADWVLSPNAKPTGSIGHSASTSHGGFDDDKATVVATLARILGEQEISPQPINFQRSASATRDFRTALPDKK